MTIQETDIAAVKRRLERIEQQCRLTKAAMAVVIVVASTVMLMGGQPEGKKGEPDRFVVRDAKGQERASLEMGKEGAALRFLDEGGKQRLWLGIANNTPGLVFYDGQGQIG